MVKGIPSMNSLLAIFSTCRKILHKWDAGYAKTRSERKPRRILNLQREKRAPKDVSLKPRLSKQGKFFSTEISNNLEDVEFHALRVLASVNHLKAFLTQR